MVYLFIHHIKIYKVLKIWLKFVFFNCSDQVWILTLIYQKALLDLYTLILTILIFYSNPQGYVKFNYFFDIQFDYHAQLFLIFDLIHTENRDNLTLITHLQMKYQNKYFDPFIFFINKLSQKVSYCSLFLRIK